MDKKEQIRKSLADMAGRFGPAATLIATVESVDQDQLTCVLTDDDLSIYDVRLRPVLNGNQSITMFPTIGSYVLAIRIDGDDDWMVMACDEIYKYRVVVAGSSFEMDGTTFLLKNENDNLKQLLNDLLQTILEMQFTTNTGVTIELINAPAFTSIQTRFNNFLKNA